MTSKGGDYTCLIVWGVDENSNIWAIDCWFGQATADIWIEKLIDFVDEYPILTFIGESGPIRRSIEPMLIRRMRDREVFTHCVWLPHMAGNKTSDSRPLQAMAGLGRVRLPTTTWAERLVDELLKFPDGRYDDMADTAFLMDKTHAAHVPRAKPDKKNLPDQGRVLEVRNFLPRSGSIRKPIRKNPYL